MYLNTFRVRDRLVYPYSIHISILNKIHLQYLIIFFLYFFSFTFFNTFTKFYFSIQIHICSPVSVLLDRLSAQHQSKSKKKNNKNEKQLSSIHVLPFCLQTLQLLKWIRNILPVSWIVALWSAQLLRNI